MRLLTIVATILLLSACSTTPYEQVYISDQGNYYIAETEQSSGYYVYQPVIMRYYGFDPWWYDRWYYSPYYSFYSRYHWPYYHARWYDPWFYGSWHGYAGLGGFHRGYGRNMVWVNLPSTVPPKDLLDEQGNLPVPISPVSVTPRLTESLDRLQRDQEAMQRGRLSYRTGALETPLNRNFLADNPQLGRYKLTRQPVKIDRRQLRTVKPATWKQSRAAFGERSAYPTLKSSRPSMSRSASRSSNSSRSTKGAVRISRPRPDRY